MGITTYLDKFRSSLPAVQGQQILRILLGKKESGEIRTVEELKTHLKDLTTELLTKRIQPTLKVWPGVSGEDIDPDQYNDMLEKIQGDLEAAFAEANTIDEVIDAHHLLIDKVSLAAIQQGMAELDSQVTLYEFISKAQYGFDNTLSRTFRSTEGGRLSRQDPAASLTFFDPRLSTSIEADYDAAIDLIAERLLLPSSSTEEIPIKSAFYVGDDGSTHSEISAVFPNSSLSNIVDGQDNTYWAMPILLGETKANGVSVKLEFDLGAIRRITSFDIEPACYFPLTISNISYYDAANTLQDLITTSTNVTGTTRFHFTEIATSRIQVTLTQQNHREIQIKPETAVPVIAHAAAGNRLAKSVSAVTLELKNTISSRFILDDVFQIVDPVATTNRYFEYVIGLDNVRAGLNSFRSKGIYVSTPLRVDKPGLLGLKATERRPYIDKAVSTTHFEEYSYPERSLDNDALWYLGSVEYWAACSWYDVTGYLITTDYLPMLPIGAERVYHERLVFSHRTDELYSNPNACSLMFYTLVDGGDVMVYRNGVLLTYGTDWSFSSDVRITLESPTGNSRMRRGIALTYEPATVDVYTVSYTPKTSSGWFLNTTDTLIDVVTVAPSGFARMTAENTIVIDSQRGSFKIDYANVHLIVVMRNNTAESNVSPAVDDFILLSGGRGSSKFTRDY